MQGVGFRPFVYRLAHEYEICGRIRNTGNGVEIVAQGEKLVDFIRAINVEKPRTAQLNSVTVQEIDLSDEFNDFQIVESVAANRDLFAVTPDFGVCNSCLSELENPADPRFFYPLIACTDCGPRYAVTRKFPFDREHTSLHDFPMCKRCFLEYNSPENRRFHAQTSSCPDCGPSFFLQDHTGTGMKGNTQDLFQIAAEKLREGAILAVKNTAGFLLLADASNEHTVLKLRNRKKRKRKPLAVLFKDVQTADIYLNLTQKQVDMLSGSVRPIVICPAKENVNIALKELVPFGNQLGAMLPNSGILYLLAKLSDIPLVATSGNVHHMPLCYDENQMMLELGNVADFFLFHSLKIEHPQDDSVLRFSPVHEQVVIYRRSRGIAPNLLFYKTDNHPEKTKTVLCLGSDLKNTFALFNGKKSFLSEYIGDLSDFETSCRLDHTINSYEKLLDFSPELVITDLHPYFESRKKAQLFPHAAKLGIQHHVAHFSAILGEKKRCNGKILGVIWDGTGFGNEREIWGGELFVFEQNQITRVASAEPFAWILGDKMAKEPRLSALSSSGGNDSLKFAFSENEWKIYAGLIEKQTLRTSSIGRLFDAVAFILGFDGEQDFQGEAAAWLENLAMKSFQGQKQVKSYLNFSGNQLDLPVKLIIERIISDVGNNCSVADCALRFHWTLVEWIRHVARNNQVEQIAFSGGVWQNCLLIDLVMDALRPEFELLLHEKLSPNDENISFGQLHFYLNDFKF